MKKLLFPSILFSILLFNSCVTSSYISIEARVPAAVSFSPDIVNVTIVDNTLFQPMDSLSQEMNAEILAIDSAKSLFVELLAEYMDSEQFFNKVSVYQGKARSDNLYNKISLLGKRHIAMVARETEADAIISVDDFFISGTLTSYPSYRLMYDELAIKILANIKTYNADGKMIAPALHFGDTLYWQGMVQESGAPSIPESDGAINAAIQRVADMLTNQFIPHWETYERLYYSAGSSALKVGAVLAQQNNWKDAAIAWGDAYEIEKKAIKKVRLAFNIALANECLDDVENALTWIRIAESDLGDADLNGDVRAQIHFYKGVLLERKSASDKLKIQMGTGQTPIEE